MFFFIRINKFFSLIFVFIYRGVWLTVVLSLGINAPVYNLISVGGSSLLTWIFRFLHACCTLVFMRSIARGLISILGLCGLTATLITWVFILYLNLQGGWLSLVLSFGIDAPTYNLSSVVGSSLLTWVFRFHMPTVP